MILIGRGLDLKSQRVDCSEAQVSSCAVLKVRKKRKEHTISGDNSLRDPPVPIPNTEVKPQHADGTWLETARESRSSPDSIFSRSLFSMTALFFLARCVRAPHVRND